jgi:hypothetical protein
MARALRWQLPQNSDRRPVKSSRILAQGVLLGKIFPSNHFKV